MSGSQQPRRRALLVLMASSGVLLGLSFPPSPLYTLAYVGFIPLFMLLEQLTRAAQVFRYSYGAMMIFHLITLYWVGGFTHGNDPYLMVSGVALVFGHPLFFTVPLLLYHWAKKHLGQTTSLVLFPFLWTAFEYSRTLSEFAFPWVTIGNSQAYDLTRIQIAEFTSVYGVSALLVAFNVLGFLWLQRLAGSSWTFKSKPSLLTLGAMVLLYVLPWMYGSQKMNEAISIDSSSQVRAGIVQPNIDPWDKWGEKGPSRWISYNRQFTTYVTETEEFEEDSLDLVVWPETALPFDPTLVGNGQYLQALQSLAQRLNLSVFSGMPSYVPRHDRGDTAARPYLVYNAARLISPDSVYASYKKVVLVPFAERVPYAEELSFLVEPLRWGVGISGWDKGRDAMVYPLRTRSGVQTAFGGMVCYESIFPWYVRQFVLGGAEFLVIITNDSWWGKTSGAYQHAAYASFRAIELRRWIVRSANGGISGFVDPEGRLVQETSLYTQARLIGRIQPERGLTFYARHGDVFAQVCSAVSVAFLLLMIVRMIRRKGTRGPTTDN